MKGDCGNQCVQSVSRKEQGRDIDGLEIKVEKKGEDSVGFTAIRARRWAWNRTSACDEINIVTTDRPGKGANVASSATIDDS